MRRRVTRRLLPALVIAVLAAAVAPALPEAKAAAAGELLSYQKVDDPNYAMPGSASVYAVTYLSRGPRGTQVPVQGTVWFPKKAATSTGYPVVSWGRGTTGLGDDCGLTRAFTAQAGGPGYGNYLGPWLKQGFVLVAPDYAGIGGPGVHPYLDGLVSGANLIDGVRASRQLGDRLGIDVDKRYVTQGGSQGGHASLFAGTLASRYAPELMLLGTTAVAPPVYIDRYLALLGPTTPALPVSDYVAYLSYVLRGLAVSKPDLDVQSYLTPTGRKLFRDAETLCYPDMVKRSAGLGVGDMLAKPLDSGPLLDAVRAVQVVPTSGYTAPVLIHQGVADVTAFGPLTDQYVGDLRAKGVSVDYRTQLVGHGVGPDAQVEAAQWAHDRWRAKR